MYAKCINIIAVRRLCVPTDWKSAGYTGTYLFQNESVSPMGSHKLNSALAQAYYCKEEGVTNVTTETGSRPMGSRPFLCCHSFWSRSRCIPGKNQLRAKALPPQHYADFRRWSTPSPSMSTRAGKDILTVHPNHQGSLGTAISGGYRACTMNHAQL